MPSFAPPTTLSPTKRSLSPAPSPPTKRHRPSHSPNPLQIKPLGNLLFWPEHRATRVGGLGTLGVLPDELLLSQIFSALDGEDLVRMSGVSKAFFGWGNVEGIWKGVYISKTAGRLLSWHGSWRSSYIATFLRSSSIPSSTSLPTAGLTIPTLHSDVLFQPSLCASFDARPLFLSPSFIPTIPHVDGRSLTPSTLPLEPVILTHLMTSWPAMSPTPRRWTLPVLATRFPTTLFRAEATLTTLPDYEKYHDRCELDESPLYLFESGIVEKTPGLGAEGLGDDYEVPACFQEDLFEVMGAERPDYRWLIVGPTRSGSTWHQDPNGTSAWNAVTVGSKAWVAFPPNVTPPGVFVSEDQGEVEAPLSLAEWFMSYYKEAKSTYGARAKDASTRGQMREGICNAGEIFFVPSGWWHIVVNLAPSIAVTQNFVSKRELPAVLRFMKHRPEQVSGFKLRKVVDPDAEVEVETGLDECDEEVSGVYEAFVEALRRVEGEVMQGLEVEVVEKAREKKEDGMWSKVKEADGEAAFSFGFFEGAEGEGEE